MNTYIGQNPKKVGKDMSFVGMHIMKDGIIAFADSKATINHENSFKMEDVKRSPIQKIFKNNKFILVTYGNNEIFSSKNKMNIEDYIVNNMTKDVSYEDFIKTFYQKVKKNPPDYNDGIYYFIIGSKDEDGKYYLSNIKIDVNSDVVFKKDEIPFPLVYKGYLVGGDKTYIDIYNLHKFYYDINIKEYSQHIKDVIEKIIQLENCFHEYKYNPVGLPVNVKIFQ